MSGPNDKPPKPRGKWFKRIVLLAIILLVAAGLVYNYCWPSNRHFTISPETTYITGPLNDDGTINYTAAMNERLSKGVTPENNAAPLLIQAWGGEVIPPDVRDKMFEILQMEPVPERGARGRELVEVVRGMWPAVAPKGAATRPSEEELEEHCEKLWDRAMARPWSADELPAVAAWLKENDKLLSLMTRAAERPRLYIPLVCPQDPPSAVAVQAIQFWNSLTLGRMYVSRAMNRAGGGDVEGACADLLTAHRLARLIAQGCEFIDKIWGKLIEEIACEGDVALAASGRLNPAQAKDFLGRLGELPPPTDLVDVYLWERFILLDMVMGYYRSKDPLAALASEESGWHAGRGAWTDPIEWDYVLRAANSMFDLWVPAGARDRAAPAGKAKAPPEDFFGVKSRYGGEERLLAIFGGRAGKYWRTRLFTGGFRVIVTIRTPIISGLDDWQRPAVVRLGLARLSLALAAFKVEKGKYPEKLSELSPGYMKAVPQDVFSDKPLIYKRDGKGYLLYSVGRNMKDDGGVKADYDAGKQSKMPETYTPVGKAYEVRNGRWVEVTDDGGQEDQEDKDAGKDDIAVRVK